MADKSVQLEREASMSGESLLVILLVGLIAGWLAGIIVRGFGFGLIANIGIGVIGALIGSWLLPKLGIRIGSGIGASIVVATIGALILLIVLGLISRQGRWRW
jgi:uncharacterized membrane protein YeaQ/YmgE (transglycosylase-associated protein family)